MTSNQKYKAIVVGTSAGGLFALSTLLKELPVNYPIPLVVVQHGSNDHKDLLEEVLQEKCNVKIKQADEKESLQAGTVYIAPADYHLLIEEDETFALSSDEKVLFSRPSIDVLFESAAFVYREKLVGILLTGASHDGTAGTGAIKKYGGLTIAQDPDEALFPFMPASSIKAKNIQKVMKLVDIGNFLLNLIEL